MPLGFGRCRYRTDFIARRSAEDLRRSGYYRKQRTSRHWSGPGSLPPSPVRQAGRQNGNRRGQRPYSPPAAWQERRRPSLTCPAPEYPVQQGTEADARCLDSPGDRVVEPVFVVALGPEHAHAAIRRAPVLPILIAFFRIDALAALQEAVANIGPPRDRERFVCPVERRRRCQPGLSPIGRNPRMQKLSERFAGIAGPGTWWFRAITFRVAPGLLSSNRMKFSMMSRSRSCASMPFSSRSASTLPLSASSCRFHSAKCPTRW